MPAIAEGVRHDNGQFYWHLGDYRAIFAVDEDIANRATGSRPLSVSEYQNMAWKDAMENQIAPFAGTTFYVGIGNHELIAPKTREDFIESFGKWLGASNLQALRRKENPADTSVKTYYHWRQQGIEFVNLDNASPEEFDPPQLQWFERVLTAAKSDPEVKTVIVGMHAALPNSLAAGHSMNNWKTGEVTGTRVYTDLLNFKNESKKNVYVLASHSHFYMKGIFDTDYWKSNGGVLPGWIVGTAGAHRYALPEDAHKAAEAKTNVYGYLLATAHDDGTVDFNFKEIKESDISKDEVQRFGKPLVHECFVGNSDKRK